MAQNLLTARSVDAKKKRGRYSDGGGLVLQVSKWGTKSWVFRYQRDGRDRHMGLGPAGVLSLADARERARECRRLLLDDRDPIQERNAGRQSRRLDNARGRSFRDCAEAYIAAHAAAWSSSRHRVQWGSSLAAYAYPVIGELPASAIDTALVLKCLEPIWEIRSQTAKRIRGRIESILDWAAVRGYRSGENPARWRGHLDKLLPAPGKVRPVRHFAAMTYADLPGFMEDLRGRDGVAARALEFTILTGLRTSEVIFAARSEIDLVAKVWTVPATRMKGRREHRVPLSKRVLEVVSMTGSGELLFPGARKGRPVSDMAMLNVLELMGRSDVTVHGFRSTFRDWAAERTNYPNHVVEMALAHAVGDKVEAAYRRGDLFEKRRRLMDEWVRYCARPAVAGEVVALRG
jgi:integrase